MDNNAVLIEKYRCGEEKALEVLVENNSALVWSIVNRMLYSSGCDKEDLFQTGCIGLLKAAKNFDVSKGNMFSTYAVYMIMGEIRRYLRDDGMIKISRSTKELSNKVKRITEEVTLSSGEKPTISEIAKKLGKKEEEIIESLESEKCILSINDENENKSSLENIISSNDEFEQKVILNLSLSQEIKKLKAREKYIILMRYYKNKTQSEVAKELGVSQVQVSRIEKRIINNLRKDIL